MKFNQKGMTLAEVLVSLLMVSIVIFAAIAFMTTAYKSTRNNQEKEFAVQKAMSILDELKSFVENNAAGGLVLDNFDQSGQTVGQTAPFTLLTVTTSGVLPGDAISGNIQMGTRWQYLRQITVAPIGSDENRLVNVKMFITDELGGIRLIAEVAGVLRTIAPAYSPTQVHDVYLLAIDNVPGWWVYMSNIVPFVTSTLQDLQTRNPGLEFRTHWIKKLSYGRNYHYQPYFNETTDSVADVNFAYFYPGLLPTGSAVQFYYLPNQIAARIKVEGGVTRNGYNATTNPFPYALADNYNNSMRYPDEKALFDQRVTDGKEDPDEPTFRLLMEDMFQNPTKYRNAIFINLHGEMFPFPPLRNYSDAAKNPETFNNAGIGYPRAVTHPENLRYNNTDSLNLRVYSYLEDPTTSMEFLNVPINVTIKNVTWSPGGVAGNRVSLIVGGAEQDGAGGIDPYVLQQPAPTSAGGNMPFYTVSTSGGDTTLSFNRSPMKSPVSGSGAGLPDDKRLYGLEYIPSPMEDFVTTPGAVPFEIGINDLMNTADRPKNTARWILEIPDSALPDDAMITIETRINSTTSGVPFPPSEPDNLSRTYAWRGSDLWIFGDGTFTAPAHLPLTERFQTIGDPRHLPYADLKKIYLSPGPVLNPLGTGFNRYFDDFQNSSGNHSGAGEWEGWQSPILTPPNSHGVKNEPACASAGCWDNDGWDVTEAGDPGPQGMMEIDVNRMFQVFRTILIRTHSAYTTLSGFAYSYIGLGNEIGYDSANGFPSGIPVSSKPFTGTGGTHNENSIFSPPDDPTNTSLHVKYIMRNGNSWFGRYWIGDLYPDDVYATQWAVAAADGGFRGNLNTGTTTADFLRVPRATIPATLLPEGTSLVPAGRSPEEEGVTAFFNIGTSNLTFHQQWSDGTGLVDMASNAAMDQGSLQTDGLEVAANYNLPVPNTSNISRPFRLSSTFEGKAPDHFENTTHNTGYTASSVASVGTQPTGTLSATFYDHELSGAYIGSGLITLKETVGGTDTGASYISMNGIDRTGETGTVFIGKWSMLTLIHSFLSGGLGASDARIRELPRIFVSPFADAELSTPTDLIVDWLMTWKRWDGDNYTSTYVSTFSEDTPTSHTLMFLSSATGAVWTYAADNTTAATPGVRPSNSAMWIQTPVGPGTSGTPVTLSWTWSGSGAFTEGSYLLRLEAYRGTIPLHYSYHQRRIFLKR